MPPPPTRHHDALADNSVPDFVSLRVERDRAKILATVEMGRGCERWLALLLAEIVARGQLDIAEVEHWFAISKKAARDPFKL
jgi:hypothetical protein